MINSVILLNFFYIMYNSLKIVWIYYYNKNYIWKYHLCGFISKTSNFIINLRTSVSNVFKLIKNIIQYYIEYRISIIYNIVIVQANREWYMYKNRKKNNNIFSFKVSFLNKLWFKIFQIQVKYINFWLNYWWRLFYMNK